MSDQELKLKITADANQAVQAVQQTGDATKKFKIDTSDLNDETKRSLGILPDLSDNLKKSGEAAEEAGVSHRELRRVLSDIGNVAAPGAGQALGELAFGPVGAALALVGAFELLRQKLDDDSAALDKLADEASKPETGGIEAVQKAWDKASTAYGDYLAKLAVAGQDDDKIKTEIDRAKELVDVELAGQAKIQDALGKTEVARLRASGASLEAIAAAEARNQSLLDSIQSAQDKNKGSGALIAELDERKRNQGVIEQTATIASTAALTADNKFDADQAKLNADRAALDPTSPAGKALQDKIDAAAAKLAAAGDIHDFEPVIGSMGGMQDNRQIKAKAVSDAQGELTAAQAERDNRAKEKARLEQSETDRAKVKSEADERAKSATDYADKNRARLNQLPAEIQQDQSKEAIEDHTRQVVDLINTRDRKTGQSIGEMGSAIGQTHDQLLRTLDKIINHQESIQQVMASYEARLATLNAQMRSMPSNFR